MIIDLEKEKFRKNKKIMKRKLPDFSKKKDSSISQRKSETESSITRKDEDTYEYEEFGLDLEYPVKRVKLIFRSGESVSLSYALNPVIIFDQEGDIIILTSNFRVIIQGENLDEIETYLSEECVVWIAESPEDSQKNEDEIIISDIILDGELFERP